jgi:hypothetical protein
MVECVQLGFCHERSQRVRITSHHTFFECVLACYQFQVHRHDTIPYFEFNLSRLETVHCSLRGKHYFLNVAFVTAGILVDCV